MKKQEQTEPYRPDYDGNLKAAFTDLLLPAIKRFKPDLFRRLDPERPPVLLTKELEAISKGPYQDFVRCDLLVRCYLRPVGRQKVGKAQIVALHFEFEGNPRKNFPYRVFGYYSRAADHLKTLDISIQVLFTGPKSMHQVSRLHHSCFGTELSLRYDAEQVFAMDPEALRQSDNPIDLVLLAVYYTIHTKGDAEKRLQFKENLFEFGLKKGFSYEELEIILRFVFNYMFLPKPQERKFSKKIKELYMSTVTRKPSPQEIGAVKAMFIGIHGYDPEKRLAEQEASFKKKLAEAHAKEQKALAKEQKAMSEKQKAMDSIKTAAQTLREFGLTKGQVAEKLQIPLSELEKYLK